MPQAIAAAVVVAANAIGDLAFAAAVPIVGEAVAIDFAVATAFAAQGGIYLGIAAGVAALTAPSIPNPETARITKKQAIPSRQSGWGRARCGGAYMLYEGNTTNAWVVLALHDGQIDAWESFYLHDDRVVLDGSGWANSRYVLDNNPSSPTYGTYQLVNDGQRYAPNHVQILTRTGLATETCYSQITAAVPFWTSAHRGDGIASLAMLCNQGQAKYFSEDYPNGLPQPSAVGRLKRIWDPRDGTQSRTVPSTWKWSANPVLVLLDYLLNDSHGPTVDYATKIAPVLADIQAEANYCDSSVTLAAGGTEPRYAMGGLYDHSNHPADVIKQILATFDGFLAQRGDGALIIKAGRYDAPTITLTTDYIQSFTWTRYVPDEQAVNELVISFTSPLHDYTEVQTDGWYDTTDITARGQIRSQNFALPWVQSNGQARRLAKRRMSQVGAQIRGTVKCNLFGLDLVENRYFTLNIPEIACLTNLVVEIDPNGKPELDLGNLTVTIPWIAADPNVDSWNPSTEEGAGVSLVVRASSEVLTTPSIIGISPTYLNAADGGGCRLVVTIANSGRADQTYAVRWKAASEVSYVETTYTGPFSTSGNITITTGLVPLNTSLLVSAEIISGSGIHSAWCADQSITTAANAALQTGLVPLGQNALVDTEFTRKGECWTAGANTLAGAPARYTYIGNFGAYAETYLVSPSAATGSLDIIAVPQGSLAQLQQFALPVLAGDNVYGSALCAFLTSNGCIEVLVSVEFWDIGGNVIGSENVVGTLFTGVSGAPLAANNFQNYTRIGGFVTAPAGARYATMIVRSIKGSINSDGHAWAAQPFLAKVPAGQTVAPIYTPGRADPAAQSNALVTVDGSGAIQGIGAGAGTSVANSSISITSGGALAGAGGGSVTLGGLGASPWATLGSSTNRVHYITDNGLMADGLYGLPVNVTQGSAYGFSVYPISAVTSSSITIAACSYYYPNATGTGIYSVPGGTITGLASSTTYYVFMNLGTNSFVTQTTVDLGYFTNPSTYLFIGYTNTLTAGGSTYTAPTPVGGNGRIDYR